MADMSITRLIVAVLLTFGPNITSLIAFQIRVKQGTLDAGHSLSKSRNGTNYFSFYGIPYAKPPLSELRFAPPQEPVPWTGVRDATTQPPVCIQRTKSARNLNLFATDLTIGEEDCLYLNVFTSYNVTFSNLVPVVVFIHGGGWQYGSLEYFDPMYFMDYPIVFVAIQYRLSVLGFLSAADDVLPGNMGMKDQVAALKWVQENIRAFGGDPKRVTLLGGSSGAMSAHFHMHSPLSEGLFHRSMSLDGTAFSLGSMVSPRIARERSRALGALFGCHGRGTTELVNCLKKFPAEELVSSLSKFNVWGIFPLCPFTIVVEKKSVRGAFLTEYPWRRDTVIHEVPWFTGITADEGCFILARLLSLNLWSNFVQNFNRLAPIALFYGDWIDSSTNPILISNSLQEFYLNDGEDLGINRTIGKRIVELFTDAEFAMSAIEAARRAAHKIPVYFYLYNHRNVHSQGDFARNVTQDLGVCHGDDLISFLYMKDISPPVIEDPDFVVSKRLMEYAVNFIYNGDPNGNTIKKVWLPVESSNLEYLHIRTNSDTMEKNLFHERYMFWKNNIIPLLNVNSRSDDNDKMKIEL